MCYDLPGDEAQKLRDEPTLKLLCQKSEGYIKPASEEAEKIFARLHNGDRFLVEIDQPRNLEFSAKYWVGLDMIVNNHNPMGFTDKYVLHKYIKMRLGVKSIKVEEMDGVEFAEYYDRYLDLREFELMPGVSREVFQDEVEQRL